MRLQILSVRKTRISLRHQWSAWTWSPSGTWWDSRADKWLRHGVTGLLGLLIVLLLVSFWIPHARLPSPAPSLHPATATNSKSINLADKIIAAHLFGQATTTAPEPSAQTITVDGIVYASEAEGSEAVVTLNGKNDVYKAGETLPDGEKVIAIGATDILLTENGAKRHLILAHYGDPDSEGPAAYAALLHGTGLSAPVTQQALTMLPGAAASATAQAFTTLPLVTPANFVSVSSAQVVHIPATATPLEQLRALRQQLIHHR